MAGRLKIKPNPKNGVVITKIDAARGQLETAIKLWFRDEDPVSVHTLSFSAYEILHPLAEAKGSFEGIFDPIYIAPGKEDLYKASFRAFHSFFKHGAKDGTATIKFDPEANGQQILLTICVYEGVVGTPTAVMLAFVYRYYLSNPKGFRSDRMPQVSEEIKQGVLKEPKADFLDQFLKLYRPPASPG